MSVEVSELIKYAYDNRLSDDEVVRRSAMSRAYYACFHVLVGKLHYYNGITGQATHQALTDYLTTKACSGEPYDAHRLKALGLTLKQQKANRVLADYKLNLGLDTTVSESAINRMKGLYHRIEQLGEPSE